jgi:hypothetical protein
LDLSGAVFRPAAAPKHIYDGSPARWSRLVMKQRFLRPTIGLKKNGVPAG